MEPEGEYADLDAGNCATGYTDRGDLFLIGFLEASEGFVEGDTFLGDDGLFGPTHNEVSTLVPFAFAEFLGGDIGESIKGAEFRAYHHGEAELELVFEADDFGVVGYSGVFAVCRDFYVYGGLYDSDIVDFAFTGLVREEDAHIVFIGTFPGGAEIGGFCECHGFGEVGILTADVDTIGVFVVAVLYVFCEYEDGVIFGDDLLNLLKGELVIAI